MIWCMLAGCPRDSEDLDGILRAVVRGEADGAQTAAYERHLGERLPHAGPQHEDVFRTWSPDGFTIDTTRAERVREHAAVPDAVWGPDGALRVLFVEGDHERGRSVARERSPWMRAHGLVGYGAIDQLVSTGGGPFRVDPEFGIEGLVPGMVVDPTVIPDGNGGWFLYYIGMPIEALLRPGAWDDGADHPVRRAESKDLVHWREVGVAVSGPNADPAVWCDGSWCLMVSTGLDRSVSTDGGRTFTFEGSFGVPGFAPDLLELPDGTVRLFYNAKERGGPLRSMLSGDRGRTWAPEPGDRVPAYTLEAPSFLPDPAGGWQVWFHYWRDGLSGDSWIRGYQFNPEAFRRGPGGAPLPPPEGAPPRGPGPGRPPPGPPQGPPRAGEP